MGEIDRRYYYKLDLGAVMLLGVLMIILAVFPAVMSFQPEGGDEILGFLSGQPARWALRLGALVLVVSGVSMVRANLRSKDISCVAFTPSSILIPGGEKRISYTDISRLSTSPGEGGRILTITHVGGSVGLASSRMKSPEEFDEMAALLAERANLPA